jgi:predicted DNA-binding antitoxin AbrB/MazE fold protein
MSACKINATVLQFDSMEIQGHYENGVIIPHDGISLPDGTRVTITVGAVQKSGEEQMSDEAYKRYAAALARIDATANENPGDNFTGADHDRELYGSES